MMAFTLFLLLESCALFEGEDQPEYEETASTEHRDSENESHSSEKADTPPQTEEIETGPSEKETFDPEYSLVLSNRGIELLKERKLDEAKLIFEKALVLDPTNSDAEKSLATLEKLEQQKDQPKDPEYSAILANRGAILLDKGEFKDAIKLLNKALVLDPENSVAKKYRLEALARIGNEQGVIAKEKIVEAEKPDNVSEPTMIAVDTGDPNTREIVFLEQEQADLPLDAEVTGASVTKEATSIGKKAEEDVPEPSIELPEPVHAVAPDPSTSRETIETKKTAGNCEAYEPAKTIPDDFYKGILLKESVPRRFRIGETFYVRGTLTEKGAQDVIAFYSPTEAEDDQDQMVFLGEVNGETFHVPIFFGLPGDYTLSLYPGTEGLAKAIEVEVIEPGCEPETQVAADDAPKNLVASAKDGDPLLSWTDAENNLFRIEISQGSKEVGLYAMNSTELTPPTWIFEHFEEGSATAQIWGAKTGASSVERVTDWEFGDERKIELVRHFSRDNNRLRQIKISDSLSVGKPVQISGLSEETLHHDIVIIDPAEKFSTETMTIDGNSFYAEYTPDQEGSYIFEINRDDHLSLFVGAVHPAGTIPLLPDYFDLQKVKKRKKDDSLDGMDTKMLAYVNKERKKRDLNTVELKQNLQGLAQFRADDMCRRNYFGHVDPDGKDAGHYREDHDVDEGIGENLVESDSVEYGHESLMQSPAHRELIIDPKMENVGFGFCWNEAMKTIKMVQIFGEGA